MEWIWDVVWAIVTLIALDCIFLDGAFTNAVISRIKGSDD